MSRPTPEKNEADRRGQIASADPPFKPRQVWLPVSPPDQGLIGSTHSAWLSTEIGNRAIIASRRSFLSATPPHCCTDVAAEAGPKALTGGRRVPGAVFDCSHLSSRHADTAPPAAGIRAPEERSGRPRARRINARALPSISTTELAAHSNSAADPLTFWRSGAFRPDLSH